MLRRCRPRPSAEAVDSGPYHRLSTRPYAVGGCRRRFQECDPVKIRNSIKSAKMRERNCVVVRRRGRLYVINKKQPRYKTRQG